METSAFGVIHKLYQESRVATADDLKSGTWVTGKHKKPGRLKRTFMPKRAKKQAEKAAQPYYATRHDEMGTGNKNLISHGPLGPSKNVKSFSRHVGGEYDPKGRRTY